MFIATFKKAAIFIATHTEKDITCYLFYFRKSLIIT